MVITQALRLLADAMDAEGQPKPQKVYRRPDGQLVADVFPLGYNMSHASCLVYSAFLHVMHWKETNPQLPWDAMSHASCLVYTAFLHVIHRKETNPQLPRDAMSCASCLVCIAFLHIMH